MSTRGTGSVDSGGVGPGGSDTVEGGRWRVDERRDGRDVIRGGWMRGKDEGRNAWHWREEESSRSLVVNGILP